MGIVVESLRNLTGGWRAAAKRCDSCKTEAAAAFCRADSAFLCLNCDTKIHHSGVSSKIMSRHERVWMCEVCEQAPAVVTCKADAAALCVTCDADIHSANPLARRHERVPVEPFYDSAESILHIENPAAKTEDMFFSELDPFLDLEYQNPMDGSYKQSPGGGGAGADSVVPVQNKPAPLPAINHKNCFDIDFCRSNLTSFSSYPSHSLSHSVSSSSLDVGVVPDGNSMSDISYPFGRSITTFTNPSMPISSGSAQIKQQLS
ncbi:hypothetical protein OIU76_009426 [Salix suchowensis]|nr:hypothetical protein OIU76_009426 [Salix suchowensis]